MPDLFVGQAERRIAGDPRNAPLCFDSAKVDVPLGLPAGPVEPIVAWRMAPTTRLRVDLVSIVPKGGGWPLDFVFEVCSQNTLQSAFWVLASGQVTMTKGGTAQPLVWVEAPFTTLWVVRACILQAPVGCTGAQVVLRGWADCEAISGVGSTLATGVTAFP